MSTRINGLDSAIAKLSKVLEKDASKAAVQGLKDVAFDLVGKAKHLAPLAPSGGTLSGSIHYGDVQVSSKGVSLQVGSGEAYAAIQHENLEYRHAPGKQAKYLEQPLAENLERYKAIIAESVKAALK